MMVILTLVYRFFLTGLFAVGGGLATLPFLQEIGADTGFFTSTDLANMVAISESTPGPMGVNMATYVGFTVGKLHWGFAGGVLCGAVATLSLVLPSLIVILIVARVLDKFRKSRAVTAAFRGLRPASMALITAAGISVAEITLLNPEATSLSGFFRWGNLALAAVLFLAMRKWKIHPIAYICIAAVLGAVLGM